LVGVGVAFVWVVGFGVYGNDRYYLIVILN
jgi:hypothetical protein